MTMPPFQRRILLLLTVALAGCGAPKTPPEATPKSPVKWEPASSVVLEQWTELVGATQPLPGNFARITAPIDGRIVSLLQKADGSPLHEGDEVAKGQEIAHLDDRIPRLNREKAESAIKTAAEDLAQAKTALNLNTDKLANLQKLKAKDAMLVADIEITTAQGAVANARSAVKTAEQHQQQAATDLDVLNQQLKLYTLTAPHKGKLGRVQVGLGQTLALGAEVAQVVDIDEEIDVICFVSQHDAARLDVSQPAGLGGLDDSPDEVARLTPPAASSTSPTRPSRRRGVSRSRCVSPTRTSSCAATWCAGSAS